MSKVNIANFVRTTKQPFVLYHTHILTEELLILAINQRKNVDIDISVHPTGEAYLGHSHDYHTRTNTPVYPAMRLDRALEALEKSDTYCYLDIKQKESLMYLPEIINKLGAKRCHVIGFVHELNFFPSKMAWEVECIPSEWISVKDLLALKNQFPEISLAGSGQGLTLTQVTQAPQQYALEIAQRARGLDAVSLNLQPKDIYPEEFISNLNVQGLLPQFSIDSLDSMPKGLYIGETDFISSATCAE